MKAASKAAKLRAKRTGRPRKAHAERPLCSIEQCEGVAHHTQGGARGYCRAHYLRFKRHGDPLAGRTPVGETMDYFLNVVLPYEGDECLIWPYARSLKGYARMTGDGKLQYVSRAVCEYENGSPPSADHEAAHSCGKGHLGCVNKRHLSWKTPAENNADKIIHGTVNRGERNGISKLSEKQVQEIRSLKSVERQCAIANRFNISETTVHKIITRKSWAWVKDSELY